MKNQFQNQQKKSTFLLNPQNNTKKKLKACGRYIVNATVESKNNVIIQLNTVACQLSEANSIPIKIAGHKN